MDPAALRALAARLAQIKHDAYTNPSYTNGNCGCDGDGDACPTRTDPVRTGAAPADVASDVARAGSRRKRSRRVRPGQTEVVVHLTDRTLATGMGVIRVEDLRPLLASQLSELIGYGPYTVKPVVDLNDAVSVNAYEIPQRIRERIKYMHPVELFPYGTRETTNSIDLDHIKPYNPHGPTGQTSTDNLAPLGRFGHRVKTHARGWSVRRVDDKTLEWTTPHASHSASTPTALIGWTAGRGDCRKSVGHRRRTHVATLDSQCLCARRARTGGVPGRRGAGHSRPG